MSPFLLLPTPISPKALTPQLWEWTLKESFLLWVLGDMCQIHSESKHSGPLLIWLWMLVRHLILREQKKYGVAVQFKLWINATNCFLDIFSGRLKDLFFSHKRLANCKLSDTFSLLISYKGNMHRRSLELGGWLSLIKLAVLIYLWKILDPL